MHVLLFLQNEKAVIDTFGTLFEEIEIGGGTVVLIQSGTNKALHVNDGYCGTPITALSRDDSSNQKWILNKHNAK